MQKGPTRQHIIPKMYLKRFADKEQAWVVDFHSNSEPYKTTLGNILCLKDFYTVATELENKDYSIEKKFAEIESDADHVINSILNKMKLPKGEEKQKLAVLIASLYVRGPRCRQIIKETLDSFVKNFSRRDSIFKASYEQYRSKVENPIDEQTAKEALEKYGVQTGIPNEFYIQHILSLWCLLSELFAQLRWTLYWADPLGSEARFVTGDFPFAVENKQNGSFEYPELLFANRFIRIWFPVSSLVCLTMEYNAEETIQPIIGPHFIPIINSQIARHTQRYIISKNKAIHWFKADRIYTSAKKYQEEFSPSKISQPIIEMTDPNGRFVPARPAPDWNKLRGRQKEE